MLGNETHPPAEVVPKVINLCDSSCLSALVAKKNFD